MYLTLNNTWSMPAQSGIHPQLRTMISLRMCKGLPVEYLSKCGTVNVLRCWTLWTCPAWKPILKLSLLYTVVNNLAVFLEAPNLLYSLLPLLYSLYAWIVICNLLWVYTSQYLYSYTSTLTSLILLRYGIAYFMVLLYVSQQNHCHSNSLHCLTFISFVEITTSS